MNQITDTQKVGHSRPLQHGPYAEALLSHLATPNLDVELMLRRVRNQVIQITKGAQVPWTQSSLLGEVVVPAGKQQPKTVTHTPLPSLKMPTTAAPVVQPSLGTHRNPIDPVLQAKLISALCSALKDPLPIQCAVAAKP